MTNTLEVIIFSLRMAKLESLKLQQKDTDGGCKAEFIIVCTASQKAAELLST